jgi:tetraacyldisaccharide 4'-kinase
MLKARLETRLNRIWYEGQPPGRLLRWLETVYTRISRRRIRAQRKAASADLLDRPIVVVGNITAGGTGKTPLVIHLCQLLKSAGLTPAVVSRGYGRRSSKLVCLEGDEPVTLSGDEPLLIARRSGVAVAVGPDRAAATRRLFEQGADVVISDDGLQRADFPRSYEICVIDGSRGLGNQRLLPAGPLREAPDRLQRVDTVVVSGTPCGWDVPDDAVLMRFVVGDPVRVSGSEAMPIDEWRALQTGQKVLAIAGIGNPDRFFDTLTQLGIDFEPRAFPDHHLYTAADFGKDTGRRIIMTEKDAVKCRQLPLGDAWYLPISVTLPGEWEEEFVRSVTSLIATAKVA